jgi:single-stranded-DNA-specific exonuclease
MQETWQLKTRPDSAILSEYRGLHSLLATLLWQRGVEPDRAPAFLSPAFENLFDPYAFQDMQKAVSRIWLALEREEKILVYADYDADAVTANAVLQQTFNYLGRPIQSYIPDRFSEGYGLNLEAFKQFAKDGISLVITVDCGVNSREEALLCKELGIDLIITDHHELIGDLPKALAVINPKVPGEKYPDQQITGVGVAYKLAQALLRDEGQVSKLLASKNLSYVQHWDKWLLDLVAIGTVADCHSLLGENRIFVRFGLKVLAKSKWFGLRSMMQLSKIKLEELSVYSLGFILAPRINAAGRLEHANIALDTLLSEDEIEAGKLASVLEDINLRRQQATARIVSEAREQAASQAEQKILVLANQDWHKGLVGIVAGRLASELGKPAIVLEQGETTSTGSARTFGEFNVVDGLKACSDLLEKFGGHKQAAGLSLKNENLDHFRIRLNGYAEEHFSEFSQGPVLFIDAELEADEVNLDLFDLIAQLEPFGVGNPRPVFYLKNLQVENLKKVGGDAQHAQMTFKASNSLLFGIAFQKGYLCDTLKIGQTVQVAAELLADTWNGFRKVKLKILSVSEEEVSL